ncbi:hypothetical protein K435DRAFT_862118 [Dendrothele bispora CBS 962.96]|uniref:Uncharacterized protein n=1 Tax=Dendrothele bispora (strain CBS 962.96) TaxID=1314807 RepID=A0A4S8LTD9_DENBC|nr:hypothetical protein K435DRAFT_862118 [Dendrothele bispora CBS 962.96]
MSGAPEMGPIGVHTPSLFQTRIPKRPADDIVEGQNKRSKLPVHGEESSGRLQ